MEIFNVWINILILIVDVLILKVLVKDDRDMLIILKKLSNTSNDTDLNIKINQKVDEAIKEMIDL